MRMVTAFTMAALCAASASSLHAQDGVGYRGYQFGASVAAVSAIAHVAPAAARTIHERPALLQELSWRRPYTLSTAPVDPVQGMVFTFFNDQLSKLVVEYDRERTEGLTNADMIESLSDVFGPLSTPSAKSNRTLAQREDESGAEVARWDGAEQSVVLYRAFYPPAYKLIAASPRLDALAVTAAIEARRLDSREAPQREIARQKSEADAAVAAQDKARAANKAAFKP